MRRSTPRAAGGKRTRHQSAPPSRRFTTARSSLCATCSAPLVAADRDGCLVLLGDPVEITRRFPAERASSCHGASVFRRRPEFAAWSSSMKCGDGVADVREPLYVTDLTKVRRSRSNNRRVNSRHEDHDEPSPQQRERHRRDRRAPEYIRVVPAYPFVDNEPRRVSFTFGGGRVQQKSSISPRPARIAALELEPSHELDCRLLLWNRLRGTSRPLPNLRLALARRPQPRSH
jgi:hypothetical protein